MRITIIRECSASPDHLHTRKYQVGEQFEVGHPLMPQGLADQLVKGGVTEKRQRKDKDGAPMGTYEVQVPAATMDDKPLDAYWTETVKVTELQKYTRHDLLVEELFGRNAVVLPW